MLHPFLVTLILLSGFQTAGAQSLTERLGSVFGGGSQSAEILPPEEAFKFTVEVLDPRTLRLDWEIVDGYYLYRDKFRFVIKDGPARIDQQRLELPRGKMKEDPAFGRVEINTGTLSMLLPLQRLTNEAGSANLELRYQGCKEDSVCYPPTSSFLSLSLPAFVASAQAQTGGGPGLDEMVPQSEQDAITTRLKEGGLLWNILAFFGFGVLLSLTPCVFPMIPILSGIIVGQGEQITSGRAFALSLAYVLAMAACYALLGIIAGLFYINLQATFQDPIVISLFSAVFVGLALSMFGFFELQLPATLQARLNALGNQQKAGSLHGAAVMGALSAIIVGPCVAPPLAGALLYISQTGNALFGGLNLFAMGLGFGVPLLLIGASAGTLLPRAGAWMDAVKKTFGVIMLGVAIWFLERIIAPQLVLLLWAALFIISAVFLGALDTLGETRSWRALWKGLGVLLLVYGCILLVGAASGSKSFTRPLQGLAGNPAAVDQREAALPFKRVKTIADLEAELALAMEEGSFVMLDFYADWCIECKEMEAYTFSNAEVRAELDDMRLLQADVTDNDEDDRALLKQFSLYGPPAILFFAPDGKEKTAFRVVGFVGAEEFSGHLQNLREPRI